MMRQRLTVYRIKDDFALDALGDAIKSEAEVQEYSLVGDFDFEARLFVSTASVSTPKWVNFIEQGFGSLPEKPESKSLSAVLLIKPDVDKRHVYALSFGFGRFLIDSSAILAKFGLKVALNSVFTQTDTQNPSDFERIRQVVAKTVAQNTLHTIRQSNKQATFELFGVDVNRDILRAVTGRPIDVEAWGTQITGSDQISINPLTEFEKLGTICRNLEALYSREDYKNQFAWIDNVDLVSDPDIRANFDELLVEMVNARSQRISLAPPEVVSWDEVRFVYSIEPDQKFEDLLFSDFDELLKQNGVVNHEINLNFLKSDQRVIVENLAGEKIDVWSVYECIYIEMEHQDESILFESGEYYKIEKDYLAKLDKFVDDIDELAEEIKLPNSRWVKDEDKSKEITEEKYNQIAAASNKSYLLLDKQTVRLSNRSSPVEICDILTSQGHFIHVKRKWTSSSLSHLFSQGFVSGELLVYSDEYRQVTLEKIREILAETKATVEIRRIFENLLAPRPPQSREFEIVFAVIADWDFENALTISRRLPFFSKVNLRRHVQALIALGFRVSFKRIGIDF